MHQLVGHWGYLALFLMCIVSSAGIPLGTEFAIAFAGALASGRLVQHIHLQLPLVILIATVGELCGSLLGYGIGRYCGREVVERFGKYVLIRRSDVDRASRFFATHGTPIVIFGRLVPVVRSFVSLGPGLVQMPVARFVAASALGCGIWCSALAALGFALGHSWHHIVRNFQYAGYVTLAVVIGLGLVVLARRIMTIRSERALG